MIFIRQRGVGRLRIPQRRSEKEKLSQRRESPLLR